MNRLIITIILSCSCLNILSAYESCDERNEQRRQNERLIWEQRNARAERELKNNHGY